MAEPITGMAYKWRITVFHKRVYFMKEMAYMSVVVHEVIGQFKFVKRHDLFHPLLSSTG